MAWMKLSFKTTPDGKLVYFPWSAFGPGYEVPTEEHEQAIRRYHQISTIIGLPLVLATAAAWRFDAGLVWCLLGVALVIVHFAHFGWRVRMWAEDMPSSDLQVTHREVREKKLAAIGSVRLWFGLALALTMSILAVIIVIVFGDVALGLLLLAIFAPLSACLGWLLAVQRRVKRQPSSRPDVIIE